MHQHEPSPSHRFSGKTVVALTALAGVLIWSKLRLVTDFPRTVMAEPERQLMPPPPPDDAPEAEPSTSPPPLTLDE